MAFGRCVARAKMHTGLWKLIEQPLTNAWQKVLMRFGDILTAARIGENRCCRQSSKNSRVLKHANHEISGNQSHCIDFTTFSPTYERVHSL